MGRSTGERLDAIETTLAYVATKEDNQKLTTTFWKAIVAIAGSALVITIGNVIIRLWEMSPPSP